MRLTSSIVCAAIVAVAAWSCGDDETVNPTNTTPTTSQGGSGGSGGAAGGMGGAGGWVVPEEWVDACDTIATNFCLNYYQCFPAFGAYFFGPDEQGCVSKRAVECETRYRPTMTNGDPLPTSLLSDVLACQEALHPAGGTNDCSGWMELWLDGTANANWPQACRLTGSGADGEPCVFTNDCQSGFCGGRDEASSLCGTCVTPPAAGQPCPDDVCEYGAACRQGTCLTLGGSGAPCSQQVPCATGFFCDSGNCAPLLAANAACVPAENGCEFGYYCHRTSATCEPWGTRSDLGGSCWEDANNDNNLCNDSWCEVDIVSGDGVCVAKHGEGEACTGANNIIGVPSLCDENMLCHNGTCQYFGKIASCE